MTEPERIIEQGVLPQTFFKEEVRNDFLVTKNRKKLWAVLLDMMLKFDEVCQKHGLRYFLGGGTLLGAVRHKGFIPWDDDVDIHMKRGDYEKLLQLTHEFAEPYFLQTPHTDPCYAYSNAHLINTNTTGFSEMFAFQAMRGGIYLDLYPLDNWVEDDFENFNRINRLNIENSTYMRMTNPCLDEKNRKRVASWSRRNPVEVYDEIQKIARQYNDRETKFVRTVVSTTGELRKELFYAESYSDAILCDYEGFQFPIAAGYKKNLECQYGDYMSFPPVEERGTWHGDYILDADIPCQEYRLKYQKEVLRQFRLRSCSEDV